MNPKMGQKAAENKGGRALAVFLFRCCFEIFPGDARKDKTADNLLKLLTNTTSAGRELGAPQVTYPRNLHVF